MKKIILSIICLLCVFTLVGCAKKDAKSAFAMRQEEMRKYYYEVGLKKDKVNYSDCHYVMIKDGKKKTYYFEANYTVEFETYTNDIVDYFEWVEGTEFTSNISKATYENAIDGIGNKTLKGRTGKIKNK